jgi:hypothetical protein
LLCVAIGSIVLATSSIDTLRSTATRNARRPYSGLETQAPDRACKDEALFSATAGTLQQLS